MNSIWAHDFYILAILGGAIALTARKYREARHDRQRIEEIAARLGPSGTRWSYTVGGKGAACPICKLMLPVAVPTGAACDGSEQRTLGKHIVDEHPESPQAADVRFLRAAGVWGPTSMS